LRFSSGEFIRSRVRTARNPIRFAISIIRRAGLAMISPGEFHDRSLLAGIMPDHAGSCRMMLDDAG
jgi:hypothetical protein